MLRGKCLTILFFSFYLKIKSHYLSTAVSYRYDVNSFPYVFTGLHIFVTVNDGHSKGRIAHYSDLARIRAKIFLHDVGMSIGLEFSCVVGID